MCSCKDIDGLYWGININHGDKELAEGKKIVNQKFSKKDVKEKLSIFYLLFLKEGRTFF